MESPTKRVLRDEEREISQPHHPYTGIIGDDLTTRLQNLGSRVRKSVYDGYNTAQYCVPPAPHSSPVKPCPHNPPPAATDFRSFTDIVAEVYSSSPSLSGPPGFSTPTSSPRKRRLSGSLSGQESPAILHDTSEIEDDQMIIMMESGPTSSRLIKPLRRPSRSLSQKVAPAFLQPGLSHGPSSHGGIATQNPS